MEDNDMEDHDQFEDLEGRVASLESRLETAQASTVDLEKSREILEERMTGIEEGGWEKRLRGLVMRVNQFQQNILQVQKLPQQLHGLQNRLGRLEQLVQPPKRMVS